jgi:Arabinose-binding domain of AraC transcription regulator, N-term
MMQKSSTQQSIKQLADLPTVQGGLTRLAAHRVRKAGIKLEPLVSGVGLTTDQINDPEQRISARNQIAFLKKAAEALKDDFLGFSLAEEFDCRELGLLYYVMGSSGTLGDALKRASRYSRITNEAIVLEYREAREPTLRLTYSGVPRHSDEQQIEFCIVAMVRLSCLLTGRRFLPRHVSMMHVRSNGVSKLARSLGKNIDFGSTADEIDFPTGSAVGVGRPRSAFEQNPSQSLRRKLECPQEKYRRIPHDGGEHSLYFAPPRASARGRGREEARDE